MVLDVAQRLKILLEGAGLSAALTRSDDRYVGLSARADYANSRGASRFVSIHANANAGTPATGTETFTATSSSANSRDMASHIQSEMLAAWGLRDRGVKSANFTVLTRTSMPATLSEMGFINNCSNDSIKLGSASERQAIAVAHYRAILEHLGRTVTDPTPTPTPTPDPGTSTGTVRGVVFEDTGAGLEDTTNRIPNARVTDSQVENLGERPNRRYDTAVGLTYDTPPSRVQAFCAGVVAIIEAHPLTIKEKNVVRFIAFGPSSLDVQVRCWFDTTSFDDEVAAKHQLNMEILRLAEALGVAFAFPSQSVYLEGTPEHPASTIGDISEDPQVIARSFGEGGSRNQLSSWA